MNFDRQHFKPGEAPHHLIKMIEAANKLHPALKTILEEEIKNGNLMGGAREKTDEDGTFIGAHLTKPFTKKYPTNDNITYNLETDSHYAGHTYTSKDGFHAISSPLK